MSTLIIPAVDLEPWPTLGYGVIWHVESYVPHGPGDLRGQPMKLDDEKKAVMLRAYEVYPRGHAQEGRRRFKRVVLSVRKGWSKTELLAAIAEVELDPDGPVRTVGWDGHGNPIGGPVTDPYIPLVAYTEEQSDDLAYSALKTMIEEGPRKKLFDVGLMRIMRKGGDGKAVSLAAAPDARDGARTTFAGSDETHRWNMPRLRNAHTTMQANLAKRKIADPWGMETTTSYSPGENSVAEGAMEYARAVADGSITDSKLFFFHRQANQAPKEKGGYDLSKPADLRAAVVEASGPAAAQWSDIEAIIDQFQDPKADRKYLYRVWLNWIMRASGQAFDVEKWREGVRDVRIADGEMITIGFDGSRYHDSTGIIATHLKTGFQWRAGVWERPERVENWEVPEIEVRATMGDLFRRFDVKRLYADPPYWETVLAEWAGEYGEERVVEWRTNRHSVMAYAVRAFDSAIRSGEQTHANDPIFERHIGAAQRLLLNILDDKREQLWVIQKERPDSPFKIDLDIAAILSWEARNDAIAAGALNEGLITSSFEVW